MTAQPTSAAIPMSLAERLQLPIPAKSTGTTAGSRRSRSKSRGHRLPWLSALRARQWHPLHPTGWRFLRWPALMERPRSGCRSFLYAALLLCLVWTTGVALVWRDMTTVSTQRMFTKLRHGTGLPVDVVPGTFPSRISVTLTDDAPLLDPVEPAENQHLTGTDGGKRYLLYLPHSGFSNQLSELENAILIARLLNRTLILPPVYLGLRELTWGPFDRLRQYIRRIEEVFANYPLVDGNITPVLGSFREEYRKATSSKAIVPLESVFSLELLRSWVDVISIQEFVALDLVHARNDALLFRDCTPYEFLYADQVEGGDRSLLVDNLSKSLPAYRPLTPEQERPPHDSKVAYLEITTRSHLAAGENKDQLATSSNTRLVHYGAHETPDSIVTIDPNTQERTHIRRISLGKFSHLINLEAPLPQPNIPLVILGTAFGSHRLYLTKPENIRLQKEIRAQLLYSNPVLESVAQQILQQLGGAGTYLGIHLRVGDGYFQQNAAQTIRNMANRLRTLTSSEETPKKKRLQRPIHVYLSTDAADPTTNPLLQPLRDCVDKIWTLSDFPNQVLQLRELEILKQPDPFNTLSRILDRLYGIDVQSQMQTKQYSKSSSLVVPETIPTGGNLPLSPFAKIWIPFVDQMVASRGYAILGTHASTFSGYMERMHRYYWRNVGEEVLFENPKVRKGGYALGRV